MDAVKYKAAEDRFWTTTELERSETKVHLPRLDVKVRVQQVGEGEPVLFIHGGPNAGSTWAQLVRHMPGYRCLLVDRPGTGLSEPLAVDRDTLPDYGDVFVGDVLDALDVGSAHVVASSFGGYLALRSAAAEPSRVERMVQMACPALAAGSLTPNFMKGLAIGPLRWLINRLPPNRKASVGILRQIGHGASLDAGRIPQGFFDWYLDLQRYTDTMKNDTDMIAKLVTRQGFRPEDSIRESTLAAVKAPTLFLWGADDGFGGEDVARNLVEAMPNAELVMLPGFGHLPWIDDPDAIAKETSQFLERASITS